MQVIKVARYKSSGLTKLLIQFAPIWGQELLEMHILSLSSVKATKFMPKLAPGF